jgi:hypothetical protein
MVVHAKAVYCCSVGDQKAAAAKQLLLQYRALLRKCVAICCVAAVESRDTLQFCCVQHQPTAAYLSTVIQHENLSVLKGRHGAGIDVEVRVCNKAP